MYSCGTFALPMNVEVIWPRRLQQTVPLYDECKNSSTGGVSQQQKNRSMRGSPMLNESPGQPLRRFQMDTMSLPTALKMMESVMSPALLQLWSQCKETRSPLISLDARSK